MNNETIEERIKNIASLLTACTTAIMTSDASNDEVPQFVREILPECTRQLWEVCTELKQQRETTE